MRPYVAFTDEAILEGAASQKKLQEGWTWAPSPVETPVAPITEELEGTQAQESEVPPIPQEAEEPTEELALTKEPTEEPDPAKEPNEEPAPAEEPTEEPVTTKEPPVELAILMATVREPAEELSITSV